LIVFARSRLFRNSIDAAITVRQAQINGMLVRILIFGGGRADPTGSGS
jgi:hypothetical protein